MSYARPIAMPHFTLERLQVKPITVQFSKVRSDTPKVSFSGLIDQHIRESMVRLSAAFRGVGLKFPADHVTIHFTPAVYEKRGADYDLLLAVGLLHLFGWIQKVPEQTLFISELGLGGELIGSERFLSYYQYVLSHHPEWTVVTCPQAQDWILRNSGVSGRVLAFQTLAELVEVVSKNLTLEVYTPPAPGKLRKLATPPSFPLRQVQGLVLSKTALVVSLVARVPLLLIGPPGVGKTMICNLAKELLPDLDFETWLGNHHLNFSSDTTAIDLSAPFRAPHYHSSMESFVGAVHQGKFSPGEFSLSNNGILFLDELPYFRPQVLEALRTPLENKTFLLSRAKLHVQLPAHFLLLAAMNPCLCGHYYFNSITCRCSYRHVAQYLSRISGPLLERFGVVHLIHSDKEEQLQLPYQSDVSSSNIAELRARFDVIYNHEEGVGPLVSWVNRQKDGVSHLMNRRRQKHMTRVALALSLLRGQNIPVDEDWSWAWTFQSSTAFFTMGAL